MLHLRSIYLYPRPENVRWNSVVRSLVLLGLSLYLPRSFQMDQSSRNPGNEDKIKRVNKWHVSIFKSQTAWKLISLRKHPFLLSLRRWGRFSARNVPRSPSGEERGEMNVFAGYMKMKTSSPQLTAPILRHPKQKTATVKAQAVANKIPW